MQHLPAGHRQRSTWQHVAKQLAAAASGGDINDAVISLRLVLQLEQVPVSAAVRARDFRRRSL